MLFVEQKECKRYEEYEVAIILYYVYFPEVIEQLQAHFAMNRCLKIEWNKAINIHSKAMCVLCEKSEKPRGGVEFRCDIVLFEETMQLRIMIFYEQAEQIEVAL